MSDTSDDRRSGRDAVPAPYERGVPQEAPARGYHYPYPESYYGYPEAEGTDWRRMLGLLRQRKWWILAALGLGLAGGYVASRFVEPVYVAQTSVWVEGGGENRGAIRPTEMLEGAGWASIFRSYAVLVPVAREHRLHLRVLEPEEPPEELFQSFEIREEVVPGLYELQHEPSGRWTLSRPGEGPVESGEAGEPVGQAAGFEWLPPPGTIQPGAPVRFRVTTPYNAALDLLQDLDVSYNQESSLIIARLSGSDAEEAAQILNDLAARFIEVATDLKSRKIREEVEILEEQTQTVAEQLEAAELALESHKIRTITLPAENNAAPIPGTQELRDPVFGSYFDRRLAASQIQADIQQLEEFQSRARAQGETDLLALRFVPSAGQSPELMAAIEQVQQKEVERRTLLHTYTEEFTEVRRLTDEIEALRRQTIPTLVARLETQLRDRLGGLGQQLEAQADELRQIPSRTIEEARRERESGLHAQLYNDLKVRLSNARLAEATAELADMQVVDQAVRPRAPSENRGPRILLMASMAGLGLGIAGVLVHDKLDRRIRYPDQVVSSLGLPVLGVVPRLSSRNGTSGTTAAVAVEAFRAIRTQLARAGGAAGRVTMVTSPAPREGKSMVSANLAISYATAGHRTLLLDGDTRRGRAQEMFGLERAPGLTDLLMERAELDDVLQETEVENLCLLARGAAQGFLVDRLDGDRIGQLLEQLADRFDAVVIDAPPLAAGADALLLGERADKVLLVVRAGSTDEALARTKLDMVGNVELHVVGTVLNAVPKSAPYYEHYVNYYYVDT